MTKGIYILSILLFVAIAVSVWFASKCSRLTKEIAKQKQTTNVKTFNFERKNIKEIFSIVEIPFESSNFVDENDIREFLIDEMHTELKSCLEYATDKDISTLSIKCRGRLRVIEVE